MKIGFVLDNINQLGGVERVISCLSHLFTDTLDHDVTVFSCFSVASDKNAPIEFSFNPKVRIVHLSQNIDSGSAFLKHPFGKKIFLKYKVLQELKKNLKTHPQDFLIGTVCWSNCLLPFFSGNAKTIACDHGSFYHFIPFVFRCLCRVCYPYTDAVVSLTNRNLKHYSFIADHKKFVIPNPLSFRSEESSSCDNKRLLVLARYTYQKGLDTLIRIASLLKPALPEWHIDIFGDGEDEQKIKALAEKYDLLSFINFHPPTKEVKKELINSSIYLLSSRFEGLPMVLLEAQACGVPVVSFDCDYGPAEIITNGEDGFLIPQGDCRSFAQAVIKLAEDDLLRKRFGKNALKNSQRFSPERVALMWQELFERLQ